MTDPYGPAPTEPEPPVELQEDLQFDQAEYETPAPQAVTCTFCKQPIPDAYYDINGKVACERCRAQVIQAFRGGSGLRRFVRASVLGTIAAVVAAVLYYGFKRITHMDWSLVSILVGWVVGGAVRKGSDHRGGWVYQALAVFLTYSAVAGSFAPFIAEGLSDAAKQQQAEAPAPAAPGQPAAAAKADPAEAQKAAPAAAQKPEPNEPKVVFHKAKTPAEKVVAYVIVMVLAYLFPFLGGVSLIGVLIIFFALQQAWQLNRKPKLAISGPFQIGEPAGGGDGALAHA